MSSNIDNLRVAAHNLCDQLEAMQRVLAAASQMRMCFIVDEGGRFAGNGPPGKEVAEKLIAYDTALAALAAIS